MPAPSAAPMQVAAKAKGAVSGGGGPADPRAAGLGGFGGQPPMAQGRRERAADAFVADEAEADLDLLEESYDGPAGAAGEEAKAEAERQDGGATLLQRQGASGLWNDGASDADKLRATVRALLDLLESGITTSHPVHGGQVKKAVEALLGLVPSLSGDPALVALALGVVWLMATGRRTRDRVSALLRPEPPYTAVSALFTKDAELRVHVAAEASRQRVLSTRRRGARNRAPRSSAESLARPRPLRWRRPSRGPGRSGS
jgi:Ca-activated chloride channel homolog